MSTKGIIKAKIDQSSLPADQYEHFIMTGIIELYDRSSEFVVRVDPDDAESIGRNTSNPKITADRTNWIFIREHVWDTIMQQEDGLNKQSKFLNLQTLDLIAATATGTASVRVGSSGLGNNMFLEGIVFLAIPYSNYPEKSAAIKFVYLEQQSKFIYALFEPSNLGDKLNARVFKNEEKLYVYGQSAKLKIYTHRFNTAQGNAANTTVKIKGEVLADGVGKIDDFELEEKHLGASIGSYNHQFEYSLALKPEWRSLSNHTKGERKLFIVRLKAEIFMENPVKSRINSMTKGFASTLLPDLILTTPSPEIQTDKNEIFSWSELDGETGNFERLYMQSYIQVRWDHLSVLLEQFEIEKQNMITYIGDIPYSKKEYNPCGFAQIRIADLSEPSREIVTIFDEDRESASMDNTPASFEIVAGEKRQDVLIKLEGLQTVDCQSLLLPPGEFHTEHENVFLMEKAFYSGQVNSFGTYVVQDNESQTGDLDVVADPNRRHDNVAGKQGLIVSEDYEIKSKEELLLKLKYVFNKSFDTQFSISQVNRTIDLAWVFNYFLLSHDLKQTYFVPVSTCRYPNQLARICVYPDIKWELNVFWNTKDPIWYGSVDPTYDLYSVDSEDSRVKSTVSLRDVRNTGDAGALGELIREERDKKRESGSSKKETATVFNRGFGDMMSEFGLSIKINYNDEEHKLSWGGVKKIRGMLSGLKQMYDLVDSVTGAKDARKAKGELKLAAPAMTKRLNAMSLQLKAPAPSVGLSWGFKTVDDSVALELKGKVKCSPLIGGDLKIDLLALANKIPLYGKLITALDIGTWVLERLSLGTLEIDYRVDLIFYADLALEEAFISYLNKANGRSEWDADLSVSGTFGGKLEISVEIQVKSKYVLDKEPIIDFEAGVEADCYFKMSISPNLDLDNKIDITTQFSGLIVKFKFKFNLGGKRDGRREKEMSPIRLIPSVTSEKTLFTL